ncbi:hypothetical protein FQA39_LY10761 [Lamprigera yunnana]|nr:hypothetical protein FQA39_LY10761 [Lamprigera yunnana]
MLHTKETKTQSRIIKSKEGTTFMEEEEITDGWQQHVEYNELETFEKLRREEDTIADELEPTILKSKFEKAPSKLNPGKHGVDNIPAKLLQTLDHEMKNTIYCFINNIIQSNKCAKDRPFFDNSKK